MDPRNVFAKLGTSRKAVFATFAILIAGVLVGLGKITWDEFTSLLKWVSSTFILATGVEGVRPVTAVAGGDVNVKQEAP